MAFIPTPYSVTVHRPGGGASGAVDDWGDPIPSPPSTREVPAAGWSAPGDEAAANTSQALGVDLAVELLAEAGRIDLGDTVVLPDGDTKYTAVTRKNYDFGPFGFRPGLDVIGLTARKG